MQKPVPVTGLDTGLLFTTAQLWDALTADVFVKCLGSSVLSDELTALVQARTPIGMGPYREPYAVQAARIPLHKNRSVVTSSRAMQHNAAGQVPAEVQRRLFPVEAWTDQLPKLLDVLRRMGLLGRVLRTSNAAGRLPSGPPAYLACRTATLEQPAAGDDGTYLLWHLSGSSAGVSYHKHELANRTQLNDGLSCGLCGER